MSDLARRTTRSAFLIVALGALAVVLGLRFSGSGPITGTGEPGDPRIDAHAVAVLEASEDAFAKSRSLIATHQMTSTSESFDRTERTELRLARPNLFHVAIRPCPPAVLGRSCSFPLPIEPGSAPHVPSPGIYRLRSRLQSATCKPSSSATSDSA